MKKGIVCKTFHSRECPCGSPKTAESAAQLQVYISEYQQKLGELIASGRYENRDDFTVVLQPFGEKFRSPRLPDGTIDFSYLAPDCFHFSGKGHAYAAVSLWNNMFEPVGRKSQFIEANARIICPNEEHPFLFTNMNSV